MDGLGGVAGICFAICGIYGYFTYKKEKEKNPDTTTMLSVLSKPNHEVLEKELKKIMDDINTRVARIEYLMIKHSESEMGFSGAYNELKTEFEAYFNSREEFNCIYESVRKNGTYKNIYLTKNDLVLMNDCLNKINDKTSFINKSIDKVGPNG